MVDPHQIVLVACVFTYTLVAAMCDVRIRKLPNVLTVTAFAAGLLFHIVSGVLDAGMVGAGQHLLFALGGFGTGFGILFVVWLIGGGGGGDVKMMAALGTWLGAWMTLEVFVLSAILVVFFCAVRFAWSVMTKGLRKTQKAAFAKQEKSKARGGTAAERAMQVAAERVSRRLLPFGVPVALATWCLLAVMIITQLQVES